MKRHLLFAGLLLFLVAAGTVLLLLAFQSFPAKGEKQKLASQLTYKGERSPALGSTFDRLLLDLGKRSEMITRREDGATIYLVVTYDETGRFMQLRQRQAGPGETFAPGKTIKLGEQGCGILERNLAGHIDLEDGGVISYDHAVRLTWVQEDVRFELLSNLDEADILRWAEIIRIAETQ